MYLNYLCKSETNLITCNGEKVTIPKNAELHVVNNFLLYDHKIICTTNSQNCVDYFWPICEKFEDKGLKNNQLFDKLNTLNPAGIEEYNNDEAVKIWQKYGTIENVGAGIKFHWNEELRFSPTFTLEHLIHCLENHILP